MFAPRVSPAVMLRALGKVTGARLIQTVASVPRRLHGVRHALASETVIATSASTMRALIEHGVAPERLQRIAMPFAPEGARFVETEAGGDDVSRDTLLFAGDYEFGDAIFPTLRAFAEMSAPIGVVPELVIAARRKTKRAAFVEARVREEIACSAVLRARVSIVGEVDSLLPFIARARCVLLPASSTYAKLDHPRVLLESIALGTRIIVGSAPSLAELVVDPTIGEVTHDVPSLREAMERAFDTTAMSPKAILDVLAERSPRTIAERYAQIYGEKQA